MVAYMCHRLPHNATYWHECFCIIYSVQYSVYTYSVYTDLNAQKWVGWYIKSTYGDQNTKPAY